MLYNAYRPPFAISPWNQIAIGFDGHVCYFHNSAKGQASSSHEEKKKNKLTANSKCGRVSKVHAHLSNLFLIGIHWRIFLEEILMCGVIN